MMRKIVCLMLPVAGILLFIGCSNPSASNDTAPNVLDKSISEKLSVKELSDAIEIDSSFAERYGQVRSVYDALSETQQATYYGITYRGWDEFLSQYGRYAEFYLMMKYPELKACAINDSIQKAKQDSIENEERIRLKLDESDSVMREWQKIAQRRRGYYVKQNPKN